MDKIRFNHVIILNPFSMENIEIYTAYSNRVSKVRHDIVHVCHLSRAMQKQQTDHYPLFHLQILYKYPSSWLFQISSYCKNKICLNNNDVCLLLLFLVDGYGWHGSDSSDEYFIFASISLSFILNKNKKYIKNHKFNILKFWIKVLRFWIQDTGSLI